MYRYRSVFILLLALVISGCGSSSSGDFSQRGSSLSAQGFLGGTNTSGLPGPNGNVGPGTGVPIVIQPGGGEPTGTLVEVTLSPTTVNQGASATLSVTGQLSSGESIVLPGNTNATLDFTSADPNIAEVTNAGVVTGIRVGTTQVIATVNVGGTLFTSTADVTVTQDPTTILGYLYIADPSPNGGNGSINSFAIEANGNLAPVEDLGTPRNLGLTTSPAGDFLYNLEVINAMIVGFSINQATGELTPSGTPIPTTQDFPWRVVTDPTGRFAYAIHANSAVTSYLIANDGQLSPNTASPAIDSENHVTIPVFTSTGARMYKLNSTDDSITIFNIDQNTGALSYQNPTIPHFPVQPNDGPAAAAMSRDDNFLYVTNSGSNSISTYTIGATGDLTLMQNIPTGNGPVPIILHPTLPVLYVASGDGTVSAFTTAGDGSLTPLGSGVPGEPGPRTLFIDPTGQFAYLLATDDTISIYTIAATGELTFRETLSLIGLSFPQGGSLVPSLP